jgi:hypothetical protein
VIDRLRELPPDERISLLDLYAQLAPGLAHHDASALEVVLAGLERDGVVERTSDGARLAT